MTSVPQVKLLDMGVLPYGEALHLQETELDRVVRGDSPGTIFFVQHPSVLTLGKNSDLAFLKYAPEYFTDRGIEITRCERGGEVTAHMPGQLVVYPILPVGRLRINVRAYIQALENAVIKTLHLWNITGNRDAEYPGVWVGKRKICAIGVRIKQRTSMHGMALNITNDLGLFDEIVPCGINGRGVTSMAREAGDGAVNMANVQAQLGQALADALAVKHD